MPTGGTAGQHLAKIDGTDYNTQWVNAPTGGGGGTTLPTIVYEQISSSAITISTGRTNLVYPSTWTEIYRKTHSATARTLYEIDASLTFGPDYTPTGGGDRCEVHIRVRQFNSSNTMLHEIIQDLSVYVRAVNHIPRFGASQVSVHAVLNNGDYLLYEAQARLQVASASKNAQLETISRATVATTAGS